MKQRFLILVVLLTLTACAAPQEIIQSTKTSVPSTTAPAPTEITLPSPTPIPLPYYLEEGILYDFGELSGEYVEIAVGIDALSTTAEGEIVALDGDGFPRFAFQNGAWVEIKIPEGAENHEQVNVQDRWVTVVTEDGKTEEVLESGVKVLVNPETGKYEYEFKNGVWVEYVSRVMVVGEDTDAAVGSTEVPKEVIETAAETVQNANMFKRVIDGEAIELKTGLDELWGKAKDNRGHTFAQWYGVLCGVVEKPSLPDHLFAQVGVEMNSGDVVLVNLLFHKQDWNYSTAALVVEGGVMPNKAESELSSMSDLGRSISAEQIANGIKNSPIGTPFYIVTSMDGKFNDEGMMLMDALETKEFLGSDGKSTFDPMLIGATDVFWNLVESQ